MDLFDQLNLIVFLQEELTDEEKLVKWLQESGSQVVPADFQAWLNRLESPKKLDGRKFLEEIAVLLTASDLEEKLGQSIIDWVLQQQFPDKYDPASKLLTISGGIDDFNKLAPSGLIGDASLTVDFAVKFTDGWTVEDAKMTVQGRSITINLGSPLARLKITQPTSLTISVSIEEGYVLTLGAAGEVTEGELQFDIFSFMGEGVLVNNVWAKTDNSLICLKFTIPNPVNGAGVLAAPAANPSSWTITWKDVYPNISEGLLEELLSEASVTIDENRHLLSFSGEVPVIGESMQVSFKANASSKASLRESKVQVPLSLIVKFEEKTLLEGEATLLFYPGEINGNGFDLKPGAFKYLGQAETKLTIVAPGEAYETELGNLLKLTISAGAEFDFNADPKAPSISWNRSPDGTKPGISLAIPKDESAGQFIFDLQSFSIHKAGINMHGIVRAKPVAMGADAGFVDDVMVLGPKAANNGSRNGQQYQFGEIKFENSRLVYGSLQATAKLPYFDDAVGTLSLFISQGDNKSLACAGTLDITGIDEFHIAELFTTAQIDNLSLSVQYDGRWKSNASMTGRMRFEPPQGKSAEQLGAIASLFKGVTLDFENLNPLQGANTEWSLTTPPQHFDIAKILDVGLHGLEISLGEAVVKSIKLLGDITIQELPGIDSSLSFGGIKLTPGNVPSFAIDRIAAEFTAPGGFTMKGGLNQETGSEVGFSGNFTLQAEGLPELAGMIKLTRFKAQNGAYVPSIAVYVERGFSKQDAVPIAYGFYLRKLGIGLGIRQALDGLEAPNVKVQEQLEQFVNNPAGLPDPYDPARWKPVKTIKDHRDLPWMLVGQGLTTWLVDEDKEDHLAVATILLAIDHKLTIVMTGNLWLFAAPDKVRTTDYIRNPVARGAIIFRPDQGVMEAFLTTLKNPKLGDSAPKLLSEALSSVQTTYRFRVDRNGVMTEIGWPRETVVDFKIADFMKGQLRAGYRYGFYRGVLVVGYNLHLRVDLHLESGLGFSAMGVGAYARLTISGSTTLDASLVGALDTKNLQGYLLGEVTFDAQVAVKIDASWSIRFKVFGKKISISFGFSMTVNVAISAAVTAALNTQMELGFTGTAEVAISVCGYGIGGRAAISYRPGIIEEVRNRLTELLPLPSEPAAQQAVAMGVPVPAMAGPRAGFVAEPVLAAQAPAMAQPQADLPTIWNYRYCRMPNNKLRVVLFPEPGEGYPAPKTGDDSDRFKIKLQPSANDRFQGFVGSDLDTRPDDANVLRWSENLGATVFTINLEKIRENLVVYRGYIEKVEQAKTLVAKQELLQSINDPELSLLVTDLISTEDDLKELKSSIDEEILRLSKEGKKEEKKTLRDILTDTLAVASDQSAFGNKTEIAPANEPDYKRKLGLAYSVEGPVKPVETEDEGDIPPPPGLILLELLRLMKDEGAKVKPGDGTSDYRVAQHMHLILEFDGIDPNEADPVSKLFDLDAELILGGKEARLKSVLGRKVEDVEYDLIPGESAQDDQQIFLAWDFRQEIAQQDVDTNPFSAYKELDQFVVTRINLENPNDLPEVSSVQPVWIVGANEERKPTGELIRPRFQFVDKNLEGVKEGDLLRYSVSAEAVDRTLATTIIQLVRQTRTPLPPVAGSLALHVLPSQVSDTEESIEFYVPCPEASVEGDAGNDPSLEIESGELRLCYRRVPTAVVGAYGYDRQPLPPSSWADALPDRSTHPDMNRLELPKFIEPGTREELPWEEAIEIGPITFDADQDDGADQDEDLLVATIVPAGGETTERAYVFRLAAEDIPWPTSGGIEFLIGRKKEGKDSEGNTRPEHISPLVRMRHAVVENVKSNAWNAQRDNDTVDFAYGNTVDAFEELPPKDLSLERDYVSASNIQSAVTYPDMDAPADPANQNGDSPQAGDLDALRPEVRIRWWHDNNPREGDKWNPVVGYRLYCHDLYDPIEYPLQDKAKQLVNRPIANVAAVPERIYRATPSSISVAGIPDGDAITGSWSPLALPPNSVAPELILGDNDEGRIEWSGGPLSGGPLKLNSHLESFLKYVARETNSTCRLAFTFPPFKAIDDTNQIPELTDESSDCYGWLMAEKLGLSVECRFEDEQGDTLNANEIRDLLDDGVPGNINVYFFLAPDHRTRLDAIRVLRQLPEDALPPPLKEVYDSMSERWLKVGTKEHPLKDFTNRTSLTNAETSSDRQAAADVSATIALPISQEGILEYRFTAPDSWAHRYILAIEKIRRYDRLQQHMLGYKPDLINGPATAEVHEIQIDRTKSLVDHNIIATPLPGAIQSLIFRHPAAYAATASAVNAAHGQYAGQSTVLQWRIEERDKIVDLLGSTINWAAYAPAKKMPVSTPPPFSDQSADWMKPDPDTELGIYGADRYVFPDLPGYYQYRAGVYSTAGRRTSKLVFSSWVDPIYDEKDHKPRSMAGRATLVADKLSLEIPVVHNRYHMRDELQALWRESEAKLALNDNVEPLPFGDLPDLYLTYLVYLLVQKDDDDVMVFSPLLQLNSPFSVDPGLPENWGYSDKLLDTSFQIHQQSQFRLRQYGADEEETGSLYFSLGLTAPEAVLATLSGLAGGSDDVSKLIRIAVQRRGVWSDVAPAFKE